MSFLSRFPIIVWFIVIAFITSISVSLYSSRNNFEHQLNELRQSEISRIHQRMAQLQGTVNDFNRRRDYNAVHRSVSRLSSDSSMDLVFIVDEHGEIKYSSLIEYRNTALKDLENIQKIITSNDSKNFINDINFLDDKTTIVAVYRLDSMSHSVNNNDFFHSYLYAQFDIAPKVKTLAYRQQQEFILVSTIIFTILFFGFLILYLSMRNRIQRIMNGMKNYSDGDFSSRINLVGADEFSMISRGFDDLAGKLQIQNEDLVSLTQQLKMQHENIVMQEHDLRVTLNSIGDAVIATDADGLVVKMNPVAQHLTGWSLKQAKGKPITVVFNIIHSDTKKVVENPVEKVLKTGEIISLSNSTTLLSKDGTQYYISNTAAPIRNESNDIQGMVLVFNDVTEQYELKKAKQESDERLLRVQKMDALGKLTGGIAHDFNNILGIIIGYSELLKLSLDSDKNLQKFAEEINHAGERGANLTRKLLSYSRPQMSEDEIVNINNLLLERKDMIEKALTARIKFTYDLEPSLWSVSINSGELEDAIVNISINAMHAMENGGSLTITTKNIQLKDLDLLELNVDSGDYVEITFSDTGCGMSKEVQEKIFDPFFTSKGDKGSGLGLSQVHNIIYGHYGVIKVKSEIGVGTCFSIYLPRSPEIDNAVYNEELPSTERGGNGKVILIVDDEPALRNLAKEIFEKNGYKTFLANSGYDALNILKNETVDLLFSDIVMPGMDGYELASIVQRDFPGVKIQLASGYDDNIQNKGGALEKNMLRKPYTAKDVIKFVEKLFN